MRGAILWRMVRGVAVINRELVYDGFLKVARYWLRIPSESDDLSAVICRERVEGLYSAAVLPFDVACNRVVLVEQLRVGVIDDGKYLYQQEPPGGVIESGYSAEETARREAFEEAGCRIGRMVPIGCCRTSIGFSDERVELFCGEVDSSGLPELAGVRDEGEITRVVIRDLDNVICELGQGPLTAATAMIVLQWLALNRKRLCEAWA